MYFQFGNNNNNNKIVLFLALNALFEKNKTLGLQFNTAQYTDLLLERTQLPHYNYNTQEYLS
jgi:hypothetical protein